MRYASVYLKQKNKRIDKAYDYAVPKDMDILPGMRVLVPFGQGNKAVEAFVVDIKRETVFADKIKTVSQVFDKKPLLSEPQIELCLHMKDYYLCLFYEALSLFTGPAPLIKRKINGKNALVVYGRTMAEVSYCLSNSEHGRLGRVQQAIVELLSHGKMTEKQILNTLGRVRPSLKTLVQQGVVEMETQSFEEADSEFEGKKNTSSDKADHNEIKYFIDENFDRRIERFSTCLQPIIAQGNCALVLFPNVEQASMAIQKLGTAFGKDIGFYHGKMSVRERFQIYQGVVSGKYKILLGTRAAFFMPGIDPALIIVDGISEDTYKASDVSPRYNTVDLVSWYGEHIGASLVFGDEVSGVTALSALEEGQWKAWATDQEPKQQEALCCIDMQEEIKAGNSDFLSRSLKEMLTRTLERNETTVLLLNRLGYGAHIFCRNCGHVVRCPRCGDILSPGSGNRWQCGTCGHNQRAESKCPKCGIGTLRPLGLGIDQVYQVLKLRYPEVPILRVDSRSLADTATAKKIAASIGQADYKIILGTSALLRPFDYTGVSLAAALLIDSDINMAGYRSSENAYHLYRRFLSRFNGEKIIQTYEPDNPVVKALATGEAEAFYRGEQVYRKRLAYPPYGHLIQLSIFGSSGAQVYSDAKRLYTILKTQINSETGRLRVFEPFARGFIRPNYYCSITIKTTNIELFQTMMEKAIDEGEIEALNSKVAIDIDPQ